MDSPLVQAAVLGIVQGLTEFLPVSSSGHLALAQMLIPGFSQPGVLLDVMLHAGTLLAVMVYFRREILEVMRLAIDMLKPGSEKDGESVKLVVGILLASVPTGIIGLAIEDSAEALFSSAVLVGCALLCTGFILLLGERLAKAASERAGYPVWWASLIIGVVQGLAVVPGISRSGSTISAARALGVGGSEAAKFSFLLSIPAIGGAAFISVVKHLEEIKGFTGTEALAYFLVGPLVAAAVGYVAIEAVMRSIRGGKFTWFSIYCFIIGAAAIFAGTIYK